GHPGDRPRRVPHNVDVHLADSRFGQKALAHVFEDEVRGRAAHGRKGEIDQVHGHLRILDLSERSPESLRHDPFWWCALRNSWNSSWNIATISALRGPRSRQRTSTSSQEIGCLKSQRFASAS